jgi:hypothetical protein
MEELDAENEFFFDKETSELYLCAYCVCAFCAKR